MNIKTTFLLLVVVGIFASLIWIFELSDGLRDEPSRSAQKLVDMEPEKINYLSFNHEGLFIECMREHGQWTVKKPVEALVDSGKINHILAVLEMLPHGETVTAGQRQSRKITLNDYGLVAPRARIVLGDTEKRHTLTVGCDSPLKDAVYVQVDDAEDVIATSTNLLRVIPRNVAEIRDLHLVPGAPAYVKRVEIRRSGGPLIQVAREETEWIIHKPVAARADWVKINALLERLFSSQIQEFVSETVADPSAYGLSDDEATVQVGLWQDDDKIGTRLFFGKKADDTGTLVYAGYKGAAAVYAVPRDIVALLSVNIDQLRDPRLYFMAPDKIASLRIEESENILQFNKNGDRWEIVEPKQWKADARLVTDLISRLNSLRVEAPATNMEAAANLAQPARSISVADAALSGLSTQSVPLPAPAMPKNSRTLYLSRPQPGKETIFAKFEDETQIYQISASAAATIALDPIAYRDSSVLALDAAMIRKIILTKDGREQAVERDGTGAWRVTPPAQGTVNRVIIGEILSGLANLRALRFERSDAKDLSVYGLKAARVSLTLSLTGGEGIQKTLIFGERSEDLGVYAMLQGQETIFVLEKSLAEKLVRDVVY